MSEISDLFLQIHCCISVLRDNIRKRQFHQSISQKTHCVVALAQSAAAEVLLCTALELQSTRHDWSSLLSWRAARVLFVPCGARESRITWRATMVPKSVRGDGAAAAETRATDERMVDAMAKKRMLFKKMVWMYWCAVNLGSKTLASVDGSRECGEEREGGTRDV